MIASGKSARIVNGDNGVGSGQSAKRLRVGHRGHHGTRLKAGNASQRRNTSPVRYLLSFTRKLFCNFLKPRSSKSRQRRHLPVKK